MLKSIIALLIISITHAGIFGQNISNDPVKEWQNLKYSMFIHWGIYSELGGQWNGQNISRGLSEQIQAHAGIYSDTYALTARRFNPTRWNADSIALLARNAGMKSIVITAKHHDGFCMFQSSDTDFDITDATPYKRDVLKDLSEACARYGLRFGLYFSIIDWHYPQAAPISSHNSDIVTPEHHIYNVKQITELLTNYGPISEVWFDMGSQSRQQSEELRNLVHKLQPTCVVSSRLGNDMGDFMVMGDNQEPNYRIAVPWQSPASFFEETWGYRSWQARGNEHEKVKEKLTSLIHVVSRGGNYLLNIGPRGDGSVVEYEKNVLLAIGQWLKVNGEAIYGTDADPFTTAFPWGSVTVKGKKLFLQVLKYPEAGLITLPNVSGSVNKVSILTTNQPCQFKQGKDIAITLPPENTLDSLAAVVVVEFDGEFHVSPEQRIVSGSKMLQLSGQNAFKYYSNSTIDYNTRFQSTVMESWTLAPTSGGRYGASLLYTEEEKGQSIDLRIGNDTQTITLDGDAREPAPSVAPDIQLLTPWVMLWPNETGLEDIPTTITEIDPDQRWPDEHSQKWLRSKWLPGTVAYTDAAPMRALYVLQEIRSPRRQSVLLTLSGGDGVLMYVNGERRLIRLNTSTGNSSDVVKVQLEAGRNQVVVKCFNYRRGQCVYGLKISDSQVMYRKVLPPVNVRRGTELPISWKLHAPTTPHQDLYLPNLVMELRK